jgi:hypothetical protein
MSVQYSDTLGIFLFFQEAETKDELLKFLGGTVLQQRKA